MLDERPFQKEYAVTQRESYLKNQRLFGLPEVRVVCNEFMERRYQGVSAEKVQARQPAPR